MKEAHPSSGGTYVRDARGGLKQVEKPTEPHPGKRELARREAKKAAPKTEPEKTQ